MSMSDGYATWPAVQQALKAAANERAAHPGASPHTLGDQLQQATSDRFLSRVFAAGESSGWLLKGGTSLLARIPDARRTQDVDLAASAADLDAAIADLGTRVNVDLGDHLRFELAQVKTTGQGQTQPGVQTRQAHFVCWSGRKKIGVVKVDVVVGPAPTGTIEVRDPSGRLEPKRPLPTNPYRLYPLADQVAEKVCATMNSNYPGGLPSSRVKDLVDLVIIARTQNLNLRELQLAIATQRIRSRIRPFDRLTIPDGWESRYRALAAMTRPTGEVGDVNAALQLVNELITPALATERIDDAQTWTPQHGWSPSADVDPTREAEAARSDGESIAADTEREVWVQPHTRDGVLVSGHWRSARQS